MTVLVKSAEIDGNIWYDDTETEKFSYRVTESGSLLIIKRADSPEGKQWSIVVEVSGHAWSTVKGDRNQGNANFDGEKVVNPGLVSG